MAFARVTASIGMGVTIALHGCAMSNGQPDAAGAARPPHVTQAAGISGVVLRADGKPAASVRVVVYPLPNGPARPPQVTDGGVAFLRLPGPGRAAGSFRRVLSLQSALTDAAGRFVVATGASGSFNVEAIESSTSKAWKAAVKTDSPKAVLDVGSLELRETGSISGRVIARNAPALTNYEGIDVFVPGSSYIAKTAVNGQFHLQNVAPGEFELVASKGTAMRGSIAKVPVKAGAITEAGDISLSVPFPKIASVSTELVAPGEKVFLLGERFGASTGDPIQVTLGGKVIPEVDTLRRDDRSIEVVIPQAAADGDLIVAVGGHQTVPWPIRVVQSLAFDQRGWDLVLRVGEKRALTLTAFRHEGDRLATASVPVQIGSFVQKGVSYAEPGIVEAIAPGRVRIAARKGNLEAVLELDVVSSLPKVETLAGSTPGLKDGPATMAKFNQPQGITRSTDGYLFVTDAGNHAIRQIAPDGEVSTLAGGRGAGFADGKGADALFNWPHGVAIGDQGDLFIADLGNHRVRRVTREGQVSTFAGSMPGFADGATGDARFRSPIGIAAAPDGALLISELEGHRIRKIFKGVVSTVAGFGTAGAADGHGQDAMFDGPGSFGMDSAGNLLVPDLSPLRDHPAIRFVDAAGDVRTVLLADFERRSHGALWRIPGVSWLDSTAPPVAGDLVRPGAIIVNPAWGTFIADRDGHKVLKLQGDFPTVVAGSGYAGFADGTGPSAQFNSPAAMAIERDGSLLVVDSGNHRIRRIKFQ